MRSLLTLYLTTALNRKLPLFLWPSHFIIGTKCNYITHLLEHFKLIRAFCAKIPKESGVIMKRRNLPGRGRGVECGKCVAHFGSNKNGITFEQFNAQFRVFKRSLMIYLGNTQPESDSFPRFTRHKAFNFFFATLFICRLIEDRDDIT